MINSNLTMGTDSGNIQPIMKDRRKLLPLEDADTSIETLSFTSNLNRVTRIFIENLMGEGIRAPGELLEIIKRYMKIHELIEKNFISLEDLRRELTYLSKIYNLREPSRVLEFLRNNVSLIPLVVEAYGKIREYFPQADAVLEVITDPEEANEELVIFIRTNLPPDEAFKRLEQLDKDWWLDASYEAGEKLCIHVEFTEDLIGRSI